MVMVIYLTEGGKQFLVMGASAARHGFHGGDTAMDRGAHSGDPNKTPTNLLRRGFNTQAFHIRQGGVKRREPIKKVLLCASNTRVTSTNGPPRFHIPLNDGTRTEGGGTLAPHLIQAPAAAGTGIIKGAHELPGVEMRAARAGIVNALVVGEQWAPFRIHFRRGIVGENVGDGGRDHLTDRWAPGNVDHWFVFDDLIHSHCARGIRLGGLH